MDINIGERHAIIQSLLCCPANDASKASKLLFFQTVVRPVQVMPMSCLGVLPPSERKETKVMLKSCLRGLPELNACETDRNMQPFML